MAGPRASADLWRAGRLALGGSGLACVLIALWVSIRWIADPAHDGWGRTRLGLVVALLVAGAALGVASQLLRMAELRRKHATPATFLTPSEERRVLEEIRSFERRTSGEIRVHLEDHVEGDLLQAARDTFERLGMTKTARRNGVLFFVAVGDHRFAVIGDQGIHDRVGPEFWREVASRVEQRFVEKRFAQGLVEGVDLAGAALAEHFPPEAGDRNELSDELSRS